MSWTPQMRWLDAEGKPQRAFPELKLRFRFNHEAAARLLASPSLVVLSPGSHYPQLLMEAVRESGARGNLVFDAQLVALCREAGVRELLTEDRDFARFRDFACRRLEARPLPSTPLARKARAPRLR